jgi:hypothetical protein
VAAGTEARPTDFSQFKASFPSATWEREEKRFYTPSLAWHSFRSQVQLGNEPKNISGRNILI